jgi:hypothetical protein
MMTWTKLKVSAAVVLAAMAATTAVGVAAATSRGTPTSTSPLPQDQLDQLVPGQIVRKVPLNQDCMILNYIPDWKYGGVDNIAVANNDGGARLLASWPALTDQDLNQPNARFILALYSRETTAVRPYGTLQVYEIRESWPENTSWNTQPAVADNPVTATDFVPGTGWKIFDVTSLIQEQRQQHRAENGVMVRFDDETREGDKKNWSGYQWVSREGEGKWSAYRPMLLVVTSNGTQTPQPSVVNPSPAVSGPKGE